MPHQSGQISRLSLAALAWAKISFSLEPLALTFQLCTILRPIFRDDLLELSFDGLGIIGSGNGQ